MTSSMRFGPVSSNADNRSRSCKGGKFAPRWIASIVVLTSSGCSQPPDSVRELAIWPDTVIVQTGGEVTLEARGYDQFFHRIPLRDPQWYSVDDEVVVVHRGRVRGRRIGNTVVGAFVGNDTARAVVIVRADGDLPSLSRQLQPVLSTRCATSGCHVGPEAPMGLDLSLGRSYASTVNVQSVEIPELVRIRPFDTRASWLLLETEGRAHDGMLDVQYPAHRNVTVTEDEVAVIRAWVRAGAPNN